MNPPAPSRRASLKRKAVAEEPHTDAQSLDVGAAASKRTRREACERVWGWLNSASPAHSRDDSAGAALEGPVNTTSYVQVLGLGTDTGDTTPSVLLFFDQERYLFNAGEGFQRYANEHGVKLNRLSGVLMTRVSTDASGGLPGVCLTLSDLPPGRNGELTPLRLYGPWGLDVLVSALRTFLNTHFLRFAVSEFGGGNADGCGAAAGGAALPPVVQNELVTIMPVLLEAASSSQEDNSVSVAEPAAKRACTGAAKADPNPDPSAVASAAPPRTTQDGGNGDAGGGAAGAAANGGSGSRRQASYADFVWLEEGVPPPLAPQRAAACYVCQLAAIPGRFLPERAKALGVPYGREFGRLKGGEAVQGTRGRMVHPHEVMEPSLAGPVVVVVDCPTAAYLPSLVASPALARCMSMGSRGAPDDGGAPGADGCGEEARRREADEGAACTAACVVHLAPAEVVALPEYRAWMARFSAATTHIVAAAGGGGGQAVMLASAVLQARLNVLGPGFFPLHQLAGAGLPVAELPPGAAPGRNLLKYGLRPAARAGLDARQVPACLNVAATQSELRADLPAVLEVLFLGTGASIPSKYRNVTGIYLHRFAAGGLLLDCGEGTYGQLIRRYGTAVGAVLAGLRLIWISHIHADHHAGLARVLAARCRVMGPEAPPLLVVGPRPLRRVLAAQAALEPLAFTFVDCSHTEAGSTFGRDESLAAAVADAAAAAGLASLVSVRVVHCAHAFGVVVTGKAGWKLAFSGDTRPCDALAEAAADATLLIHEATFEDPTPEADWREVALTKRHSMTGEAIEVGQRARAYRTILTHFSQRYPKIPAIGASFTASTCIAFDLLSVNLADLPMLPALVPPVQLLFQAKYKGEAAEEREPILKTKPQKPARTASM
ncbi:hypothetical protein WJX81_005595 [Elliptochloris bilobata]|uniref:ribonuclease Z n=1 Tax=Elliptochloris bilobata TaxID=381761 RepID=A0AAW1QKJ3_9CHLO